MLSNPKISIITVVFNGNAVIERTIKSVLQQTHFNIEYIILMADQQTVQKTS